MTLNSRKEHLKYLDLPYPEMIKNRQEHLAKLEAQLPTTTHPIDKENLLMSINTTQAVITFCESYIEMFPDK